MSVVTLAVGQAGVQASGALYQLLADEAALGGGGGGAWSAAADRHFYLQAVGGQTRPTARAILVDTEPSAVVAAHAAPRAAWQFSRAAASARCMGGGSAGCWARGALGAGPALGPEVLGMLRRQAERCDTQPGILVLQSLTGGTGSGLGSALVQAIRDEYPTARMLSHCFWPTDSPAEVPLQPYNALLGLTSLAEHASGVVLTENAALAATCQRLLGIQRPTHADLNAVAARSLAALLLPCSRHQAPDVAAAAPLGGGGGSRGRGRGRGRPGWDSSPAEPAAPAARQQAPAAWDGTFGSGSRWEDEEPSAGAGGGAAGSFDPLVDACDRLCGGGGAHRLLTLRCGPTLPRSTFDFTPFAWPAALKGLRDMQLAGSAVEGSVDSLGGGRNKALGSLLVLRGDQAAAADVGCLADAALYSARRHSAPLAVACSGARLGGQQMLAALLSNDQTPVAPLERALGRARMLHGAGAYLHTFERAGMSGGEVGEALEAAAGLLDAYKAL